MHITKQHPEENKQSSMLEKSLATEVHIVASDLAKLTGLSEFKDEKHRYCRVGMKENSGLAFSVRGEERDGLRHVLCFAHKCDLSEEVMADALIAAARKAGYAVKQRVAQGAELVLKDCTVEEICATMKEHAEAQQNPTTEFVLEWTLPDKRARAELFMDAYANSSTSKEFCEFEMRTLMRVLNRVVELIEKDDIGRALDCFLNSEISVPASARSIISDAWWCQDTYRRLPAPEALKRLKCAIEQYDATFKEMLVKWDETIALYKSKSYFADLLPVYLAD